MSLPLNLSVSAAVKPELTVSIHISLYLKSPVPIFTETSAPGISEVLIAKEARFDKALFAPPAALVQSVPFEVKTFPDVPGATLGTL